MISHIDTPEQHQPVTSQDILRAYAEYSSNQVLYTTTPTIQKPITLQGSVGLNNYRPIAITSANAGNPIRGQGFVIDPATKFIRATRDMFAIEVQLYSSQTWSDSDNICLGVGIGNSQSLPQFPGQDVTDKQYISRFFDNMAGSSNRIVTLKITQSPIGRNTVHGIGVKQGDLIFPVAWTQESDSAQVNIYDIIMNVTEIPYIT